MALVPHPNKTGFLADFSAEISMVPNIWGLVQRLGLFENRYGRTRTVNIYRTNNEIGLLEDRNWSERHPSIGRDRGEVQPFAVPHYPVGDAIYPEDLAEQVDLMALAQGRMELKSLDEERVRKYAKIRAAHANTLEYARMQVLKDGTVYAPNSTVNINYYTSFGTTREVVDLDLTSLTTAPDGAVEEVIGKIQDSTYITDNISGYVALCSPAFFQKLITNPFLKEAAIAVRTATTDELLWGRPVSPMLNDARYRGFDWAGITWIEVRGTVAGQAYITADDAYILPLGVAAFETWFAPAMRFSTINSPALESYYFEDYKDDQIQLETETNFLNILKRPELIKTLRHEPE